MPLVLELRKKEIEQTDSVLHQSRKKDTIVLFISQKICNDIIGREEYFAAIVDTNLAPRHCLCHGCNQ